MTAIQNQIHRLSQLQSIAEDEPLNVDQPEDGAQLSHQALPNVERPESVAESVPQPDQEPDAVSHQDSQPSVGTDSTENQEIQQFLVCEERSVFNDVDFEVAFR